jgi:acetyltransferase-like isoleucine patch superfamily enzyme
MKLLDSFLLKLRARLEHLAEHQPSTRYNTTLRHVARIAASARVYESTRIDSAFDASHLVVGEHVRLHGIIRLARPDARVTIGDYSYVGPGTRIVSGGAIAIGAYVYIADQVDITDTDSHSLDWRERRAEAEAVARNEAASTNGIATATVTIEDDVWIGAKATVLKGVTVGRGAVVAAGAVVTSDVAPFTLVAGVPAKVVRELSR